MDRSGYVKLFRKSLDSDVFEDDVLWKVWTTCLMLATWEPDDAIFGNLSEAIHLEPGEFVTGQFSFLKACYPTGNPPVSSRTLWRKLSLLKSCKMIAMRTTKTHSVVSIIKWEDYQGKKDETQENKACPSFGKNLTESWQEVVKEVVKDTLSKNEIKTGSYEELQDALVKEVVKNLSKRCQRDVKEMSTLKKIEDIKEKDSCPSGEGQAPEVYLTAKKKPLEGKRLESFLRFWTAWNTQTPWGKQKADAADAWLAIPQLTGALVAQICEAATAMGKSRVLKQTDRDSTPIYPATWLRKKCWEDYEPGSTPMVAELPQKSQKEIDDLEAWTKWEKEIEDARASQGR